MSSVVDQVQSETLRVPHVYLSWVVTRLVFETPRKAHEYLNWAVGQVLVGAGE